MQQSSERVLSPRAGETLAVIAAVVSLVGGGCAGQKVRGRADVVGVKIKSARANGAYYCAPKELALAEAHLQRTRDELALGNLIPAQHHIEVAHKNAQDAYDRSPADRCVPTRDSDGDGIPDAIDQCPFEPEDFDGFEDEDGCPDPDNDNDGIPDALDRCPNVPEDHDGYQDEDGCPDLDNDHDGIPDALDQCPNQPEDHDGFQDEDGCPDDDNDNDGIPDLEDECPNQPGSAKHGGCPAPKEYKLVRVTGTKIELKQKVFFATARTRILPRSFPLLHDVARALKDNPRIYVRIEGHTDSRGNESYNLRLSQGRANSVRLFLVQAGIDPVRLEAVGYGEDRPIESNRTRSGRAMNRRVEFVITRQ